MEIKKKVIDLHPKQAEAFTFDTQYCAAISGIQGGKTYLGCIWAAKNIAEKPGDGLIAAPTYKILQHATMPKFFELFPEYRKYYKEQKGVLEFPDKNIYVRSMDNPLGVEGMTLDWVWGDEAGQYSLLAWTVLRSRTSIRRGRILFTTTPYNMGWLYQDFFLPWQKGEDEDLSVVTWASVDNPYFPPDFFEKEKKRLSKEEFRRRYMGEFTRMEGLVYDVHEWHKMEAKEIPAEAVIGGIDWGYTNPAALQILKWYDGRFYIVDEWYMEGKTTPEIIAAAKNFQTKYKVNIWYADSANPEKIAEANDNTGLYVIGYEKTKDSLTFGISTIQQLLREKRLYVFKSCVNTLSEFEAYHYPETVEGKDQSEDPVAKDNHLMDAMRYGIMGYAPVKTHPLVISDKKDIFTKVGLRQQEPHSETVGDDME